MARSFSSSSESSAGGSSEAGDCGSEGPLPDSYSSSVGPVDGMAVLAGPRQYQQKLFNIRITFACSSLFENHYESM